MRNSNSSKNPCDIIKKYAYVKIVTVCRHWNQYQSTEVREGMSGSWQIKLGKREHPTGRGS